MGTPKTNANLADDNNSTSTVDANAPQTVVPARTRRREVPRRLWFAAASAVNAVALLLCLFSLTTTAGAPPASDKVPPILLFNGTGTSENDVAAIETILKARQLSYSTARSKQLDGMSESQLREYRLLIIPGGNYIDIGKGLSSATTAKIRTAVEGGLNYLGVCAGGFLAGDGSSNCLNLTSGVRFDFYTHESQWVRKAVVKISGAGTPTLEQYWEDGPEFTGWGAVVGKYPDGAPAIVQGTSGKGWVLLCGVHPEAPEDWREGMTFTTPASVSNAYAGTLIEAALHGTRLPQF